MEASIMNPDQTAFLGAYMDPYCLNVPVIYNLGERGE